MCLFPRALNSRSFPNCYLCIEYADAGTDSKLRRGAIQARLKSNARPEDQLDQLLENAFDRPGNALADVLSQPPESVGRNSAAMSPAFRVEKEHQAKPDTRADSKTFLHHFLH